LSEQKNNRGTEIEGGKGRKQKQKKRRSKSKGSEGFGEIYI